MAPSKESELSTHSIRLKRRLVSAPGGSFALERRDRETSGLTNGH